MGGGFGFDQRFDWSLRLGGDVGWFFLVASLGLSSGLDNIGRQMLGSNIRGLLDPEHGKNVKVGRQKVESECVNHSVSDNKCTGFLSWGNPQGVYL
jgi:hypothetical protein